MHFRFDTSMQWPAIRYLVSPLKPSNPQYDLWLLAKTARTAGYCERDNEIGTLQPGISESELCTETCKFAAERMGGRCVWHGGHVPPRIYKIFNFDHWCTPRFIFLLLVCPPPSFLVCPPSFDSHLPPMAERAVARLHIVATCQVNYQLMCIIIRKIIKYEYLLKIKKIKRKSYTSQISLIELLLVLKFLFPVLYLYTAI